MMPGEMVRLLDDAIAQAPRGRKGRRLLVLELASVPGGVLLGVEGYPTGYDEDGRPTYGFTRAQCVEMRQIILDAAHADMAAGGVDVG